MKYKIWNKTDTLFAPSGEKFTAAQILAKYPLAEVPGVKFIICDAPISMGVFMEFEQTKMAYKQMGANIQDGQTVQEVLDAISDFEENPPSAGPSVEERTAAALEFLALNSLPE
jgi:hypothetical protein